MHSNFNLLELIQRSKPSDLCHSEMLHPKDATNKFPDQDLLLTGTCESQHALSNEEWKKHKLEIKDKKNHNRKMMKHNNYDNFTNLTSIKSNWAHRLLTLATVNTTYKFVYMGSPCRMLHSEIRKALCLVEVVQDQVIDI
ncbi:hypothetical protein BDC45DRAFT_542369 [Circinella umbellata]|nr:hypothetical protein BDC45DRAFT_542369 [Circinella umbellata]